MFQVSGESHIPIQSIRGFVLFPGAHAHGLNGRKEKKKSQ